MSSLRAPAHREASPGASSMTITSNFAPSRARSDGLLRLRGAAPTRPRRRIQWADSVVDNEGMGKKRSKACCIYHPPREVGESSDESSSSDSSDSDSEPDLSRAQAGRRRRPLEQRNHNHHKVQGQDDVLHSSDDDSDSETARQNAKAKKSTRRRRRSPSPNAYEKMPTPKNRSQRAAAAPSRV